jgi:hypothetical protein
VAVNNTQSGIIGTRSLAGSQCIEGGAFADERNLPEEFAD